MATTVNPQSSTARPVSKVRGFASILSANVVSNGASFVITVHAAKEMGPAKFGALGLAISLTSILAVVFDFGLSLTLVRQFQQEGDATRTALARMVMIFKTLILIGATALAYPLRYRISDMFFPGGDSADVVFWAIVSGASLSLWMSVRSIDQAKNQIRRMAKYTYAYAVLRIITYSGLLVWGAVGAVPVLLALYVVPIVSLVIFGRFSSEPEAGLNVLHAPMSEGTQALKRALSYGSWVALSGILYMLTSRAPQFVLARFADREQLGLFSAALTFTAAFSMLNDAARTVLLADVAGRRTAAERESFRKAHRAAAPRFFTLSLLGLMGAIAVQSLFLGKGYRDGLPMFFIMGSAIATVIFVGLANTLVHSLGVPRIDTAVNFARLVLLVLLALLVRTSGFGVALVYVVVVVGGELVLYEIIRRKDESMCHVFENAFEVA